MINVESDAEDHEGSFSSQTLSNWALHKIKHHNFTFRWPDIPGSAHLTAWGAVGSWSVTRPLLPLATTTDRGHLSAPLLLPNGKKDYFLARMKKVIFSVKFLYNSRIFIFWVGLNFCSGKMQLLSKKFGGRRNNDFLRRDSQRTGEVLELYINNNILLLT